MCDALRLSRSELGELAGGLFGLGAYGEVTRNWGVPNKGCSALSLVFQGPPAFPPPSPHRKISSGPPPPPTLLSSAVLRRNYVGPSAHLSGCCSDLTALITPVDCAASAPLCAILFWPAAAS
ncbi:hypothetical protein AUP68_02114 [Ilyonectria robusta]